MPTIITTKDGSHSLLNEILNETYHSTHGALRESRYVFIDQGLRYFQSGSDRRAVNILEVGFGTGLNALLVLEYARLNQVQVRYHTLEAFPLDENTWMQLNYGSELKMQDEFAKLHQIPWNTSHALMPEFTLLKQRVTLQDVVLPTNAYDIVFFDAFAPSKQPEMWEPPMLSKINDCLSANSVFVTYCAKGQLKRDLKALGLVVETLPGPPGKKEMVRATKTLHLR